MRSALDIAAGGWKSGSAAVMLSKPVVTVTGSSDADAITINVEDKNCDIDGKLGKQAWLVLFFFFCDNFFFSRTINTCLKYVGVGDTPNDLEFLLTYNLDDHSPEPRAYFIQKDIVSFLICIYNRSYSKLSAILKYLLVLRRRIIPMLSREESDWRRTSRSASSSASSPLPL